MNDDFKIPSEAAEVQIRGRENAFLVFASLACDVVKTAHALGVREKDVSRMAEEGRWNERLKSIVALKNSSDPAQVERLISRCINFVQAHRFRLFIERAVNRLSDMTNEEFESYLLVDEYNPKTLTTKHAINGRGIADLASAMEKCHALTYLALADTTGDRNRREEAGESREASGDLHRQISLAMAELASEAKTPEALLTEAQLASAAVLAEKVKVTVTEPEKPYDKGD